MIVLPPPNLKGRTRQKYVSMWELRGAGDRFLGAQMMSEPLGLGLGYLGFLLLGLFLLGRIIPTD